MKDDKCSNMSEDELIKKFNEDFDGEYDLAQILMTLEKKEISKKLIGHGNESEREETVLKEYMEYHNKLNIDTPSKKETKKAINVLKQKSPSSEKLKIAILTLAHSKRADALHSLEKYMKKAKEETALWVQLATEECKMFIESKLVDEPKIKIIRTKKNKTTKSSSNTHILLDYFFNKDDEVKRAIYEFFNGQLGPNGELYMDNMEEYLFMDWAIYDFRLSNGNKLIVEYISEKESVLTDKERESFEEMCLNKYGLYEVKDIVLNKSVTLESLQSGKIYKTIETKGTHGTIVGSILICRVGKQNGDWKMTGSDPLQIPINLTKRAKRLFFKDKLQFTPKETKDIMHKIDDLNS